MPKLAKHRYGKARVRILKVLRDGSMHRLKDVDAAVFLQGEFASSYTSADNTSVVPTDTIKNTVNVLAKQHLTDEIERFAIVLGDHFLRYPQVREAQVEISERDWRRMEIEREPHPHSFISGGDSKMFTRVVCTRDARTVQSGIRNLVILKSTGSGFQNYPKDEFTTLRETADRILATSFSSTWTFEKSPPNYGEVNRTILSAMLKMFAQNYSPSAQTSLFQMGEAALAASPEIARIDLVMPNKHCLLIDLSPFGLENKNEIFVPTDEPHGQIEASLTR